jgi:hypothetical protein
MRCFRHLTTVRRSSPGKPLQCSGLNAPKQYNSGATLRGSKLADGRAPGVRRSTVASPGCHVQLFARTSSDPVRWRLLSGNNREIGRGAESFVDAETCRVAVKELQAAVDSLEPSIRRDLGHRWVWHLALDDRSVATSAHGFDRLIRCERAVAQFREELRIALIGTGLMISQTRRWGAAL